MPDQTPRLIYVTDDLPGISRRRAGKGWSYTGPDGERIVDAQERARLNAVALPPAYTDAWFCPAPNGHILATGIDARGRKQYRYHPQFRTIRESRKFDRCLAFGKLLPLLRERVDADLGEKGLGRRRAIASVVRALDLGALRVGNECYAKSNASFGATTLRRRHAKLSGRTLKLRYKGKGGAEREVALSDGALARCVRAMQDLPGQRLFQWLDDDAQAHDVGSADVNAYLREVMGEDFSARNFRTWHASALGFATLATSSALLPLKAVLERVAGHLGNTPAVTRKSYVHPAVIAIVERQEKWRADLRLPRRTRWMAREERGLCALLEESPPASELVAAA